MNMQIVWIIIVDVIPINKIQIEFARPPTIRFVQIYSFSKLQIPNLVIFGRIFGTRTITIFTFDECVNVLNR